MPNVLVMSTSQLCDPVATFIRVIADDRLQNGTTIVASRRDVHQSREIVVRHRRFMSLDPYGSLFSVQLHSIPASAG